MADHKHDPDWDNIEAEISKGVVYVQVRCKDCGSLATLDYGPVEAMNEKIDWDE